MYVFASGSFLIPLSGSAHTRPQTTSSLDGTDESIENIFEVQPRSWTCMSSAVYFLFAPLLAFRFPVASMEQSQIAKKRKREKEEGFPSLLLQRTYGP